MGAGAIWGSEAGGVAGEGIGAIPGAALGAIIGGVGYLSANYELDLSWL